MQGISVCWFYTLQLYYIHWLTLVIFWWCLQGFLCRRSCHLQTVSVLLLLFQFGFLLFLFLLWLLWPKLPELCWIVVVKSGHPCLVLDFRGNAFNFSPLGIMFAVGYSFYYVEACSFYSCFLEGFYHKWMLSFIKGLLCICWDNHMAFIFQFVNVVYYIDWFVDIDESLHSWDKAHWSWCMVFLMCCWILIARILLRIFASMFISDIGL